MIVMVNLEKKWTFSFANQRLKVRSHTHPVGCSDLARQVFDANMPAYFGVYAWVGVPTVGSGSFTYGFGYKEIVLPAKPGKPS